jgi:hypothetical protein
MTQDQRDRLAHLVEEPGRSDERVDGSSDAVNNPCARRSGAILTVVLVGDERPQSQPASLS